MHPSTVGEALTGFACPESADDFRAHPTAKLSALIDILEYHLAEDRRPPLKTQFNDKAANLQSLPPFPESNQLVPDESFEWGENYAGDEPDKVIIFSAFPLNNAVIVPVSLLCTLQHITPLITD